MEKLSITLKMGPENRQRPIRGGKLHGPFTDYYEDGAKRSEGTYKAGQFQRGLYQVLCKRANRIIHSL